MRLHLPSEGFTASGHRQFLSGPVTLAWEAFDRLVFRDYRVTPAIPILFFGDLDAYLASQLRVVTVGLNPARKEFPVKEPFLRFPPAVDNHGHDTGRYLEALSAYFRTEPYRQWFNSFEPLLNGMGASYYQGNASTALHTDICSPIATDPTWSKLDESRREELEADGGPLWHLLLEELRPQVVVLSVARDHLRRIEFTPITDWSVVHAFRRKRDGSLRPRRNQICGRWYDMGGGRSLVVFGKAAELPFMHIDDGRKREAGQVTFGAYQNVR